MWPFDPPAPPPPAPSPPVAAVGALEALLGAQDREWGSGGTPEIDEQEVVQTLILFASTLAAIILVYYLFKGSLRWLWSFVKLVPFLIAFQLLQRRVLLVARWAWRGAAVLPLLRDAVGWLWVASTALPTTGLAALLGAAANATGA